MQLTDPGDRDQLRFSLTSEAGLNDGSAFPFVLLGLGLLGLHELGTTGWQWLVFDVLWATFGGLTSLSYGLALLADTYGFLAVFAAGLALRRFERQQSGDSAPPAKQLLDIGSDTDADAIATDPRAAPAYMTQVVMEFNERAEHIGEFFVVLFVGAMLTTSLSNPLILGFILLLFLLIRPLAVWFGLLGSATIRSQWGF